MTLDEIALVQTALRTSEPLMKHYPEPVERHAEAVKIMAKAFNDELYRQVKDISQ